MTYRYIVFLNRKVLLKCAYTILLVILKKSINRLTKKIEYTNIMPTTYYTYHNDVFAITLIVIIPMSNISAQIKIT